MQNKSDKIPNLQFRCTVMDADPSFNYGMNPCGKAMRFEDIYLCGDKFGRYCSDYTSARCGYAIPYEISCQDGVERRGVV